METRSQRPRRDGTTMKTPPDSLVARGLDPTAPGGGVALDLPVVYLIRRRLPPREQKPEVLAALSSDAMMAIQGTGPGAGTPGILFLISLKVWTGSRAYTCGGAYA